MEDDAVRLLEISEDTESSAIVVEVTDRARLFIALQIPRLSRGGFLTMTDDSTDEGTLFDRFLIRPGRIILFSCWLLLVLMKCCSHR